MGKSRDSIMNWGIHPRRIASSCIVQPLTHTGYRELTFSANSHRPCWCIPAPCPHCPECTRRAFVSAERPPLTSTGALPLFLIVPPAVTNQIMVQKMFKPSMYEKWMSRQRRFCRSPLESQVHANGLSAAMHVQFLKNPIRDGMDGRRRVSSKRGNLLVGKAQDQVGHYFAFRRGHSAIYGRQEASARQASDQDLLDFSREGFPSSQGITQDLFQRFHVA